MRKISIAGHSIGDGNQPFIVAEVGLNHNGNVMRAVQMIEAAANAGCTAVKFQTFRAHGVCSPDQLYTYRSQGQKVTEPRINLFRRAELPQSCWSTMRRECERMGVVFMSTPQNPEDVDVLLQVGVPALKIGSDDLTNEEMLAYCAKTSLPLILSCGMSDLAEVYRALELVGAFDGREVALLVCTSRYPCPLQDANLSRITALRAALPAIPIGFSDHTQGAVAAASAVALGACIFEKHMTLSHDLPGPDHEFSANPNELADWVAAIRGAHEALGNALVRPTTKERENKLKYQRKAVLA